MNQLRKIGLGLAWLAFAAAAGAEQQAARTGPLLTLPDAVSLASGEQPIVTAYERDAQASEQGAIAARTLPDLRLTAGILNFPITGPSAFSPTAERMTMLSIGIMREQVRRSKREAEAASLNAEALVSRGRGFVQQRQIVRRVMIAWINAVEAHHKAQLLDRLIADLRSGRKALEAGVSTGASTPALVLQMDAEIGLKGGQMAEAQSAEERARSELARWIGEGAASRPLPDSLPLIEAPRQVPAEVLRLSAHPDIQVAAAEQEAAARQIDIARQDRRPDISWSVMLGIRPQYGEMVSGQVSIPLQFNRRDRQDRKIAEAQLRADAAQLRLEDTRRDLIRQYQVARADVEGADAELIRINRDAVPALESAFAVAEARYAGGGGTLDQPFDIVRRYVETSITSVETRAKRDRAVAEMLYVLGETGQ